MAFTYDGGNVATVDLDFVRFETSDVDSTAAVHDEPTLTALIVLNGVGTVPPPAMPSTQSGSSHSTTS